VDVVPADELIERVRALPAARPLIGRLEGRSDVYLVGGAVRDLLLGATPPDLDLLVEGDPAQLADELGGALREHGRFGTAKVELGGFIYDIARARTETYARPGALPDVRPATVSEDLGRRDFTVNAMAIALGGARAGELVTVPGALDDLAARRLRVLHDGSFLDDPTRVLRLARYAARLAFAIEADTERLAREALASGALATLSADRLDAALRLLAREQDPVAALEVLKALGAPILSEFDPELARRALELLPADGRPDELVLRAALARSEAAPVADALASASRPSEIAAAVASARIEEIALAGALGPAPQAREWLERLRHVRLEIDGADLLAAGVPQGPAIGAGIRAALQAKLDGLIAGREQELAEALRVAR
jgi:tRNA nucleotidyltransferase (CCA-adding enzyme)